MAARALTIINRAVPSDPESNMWRKTGIRVGYTVKDDDIIAIIYDGSDVSEFDKTASRWERIHSEVLLDKFGWVKPLVRNDGVVVGHIGTFTFGGLYTTGPNQKFKTINELRQAVAVSPIFVDMGGARNQRVKNTEQLYINSTLAQVRLPAGAKPIIVSGGLLDTNVRLICTMDGVVLCFIGTVSTYGDTSSPLGDALLSFGITSLIRKAITKLGATVIVREVESKTAQRLVVNIGGTGEVNGAVNLNPNIVAPRTGIPNHIAKSGEEIASVFKTGTVDEIVSNRLPPNTIDWVKTLTGSHKVLRKGGKITIQFQGAGDEAKIIMEQFKKLGFKNAENFLNKDVVFKATK